MPQTRTFEINKLIEFHFGYATGYALGWSDAQAKAATVGETVEAVAQPAMDGNPLVSVHGVFQNDPTWDSYLKNIEEYRRYINSLEE